MPVQSGNSFRRLHEAGFTDLTSIIPPGAQLSPNTTIKPQSRGKCPGLKGPDGWHGYNWHTHETTEEDLDRWHADGASVGLRLGNGLVALDIDCLVQSYSKLCYDLAVEIFGQNFPRIGRSPKVLLLLRVVDSDIEAVVYRAITFDAGQENGRPALVELLDGRRQCAMLGTYPTLPGEAPLSYRWPFGLPTREFLPLATLAQFEAYFAKLAQVLPDARAPVNGRFTDRATVDQDRLAAETDEVERLVALIPNGAGLGYDDMVRMAVACRAACRDDFHGGLDVFLGWCRRWEAGDTDEDECEHAYRSVQPPFAFGVDFLENRASSATGTAQGNPDRYGLVPIEGDVDVSHFHVVDADAAGDAPAGGPTAADAFGGAPLDIFGDDDSGSLSTPPAGILPGVIETYAQVEAERIGVPMIFAAAAAVTVAGGAIGNALQIQPRRHDPTYTEPAALWTVLVGPPGCAKSPTNASALKPLRDVDRRLMAASEREHRAYGARKAAAGKALAVSFGPPPPWRRAVIDDVTPEQQIRLHQQNPRGLMRSVDEYVSFLSFGTYKRSGDGDRGRALQFFDGGSVVLDRVSEARPIRADSALMGLLSSTQPDRIGPLFRNLGVDGLGQRTLFILWDGVERRFVDRTPDLTALAEYASAITAMTGIDKMSGGVVRLSDEAHTVMDRFDELIRRQAHLPGASAAWEGHISKWGKLLPRITLIFHALETWSIAGSVPVDTQVTADTMRKAGRFALFLLKHSWQFYRINSEPQDRTAAARWIAGWILAHPEMQRFTPRCVDRAYKELRKDRSAIIAAVRVLEDAGWVQVSRPAPPGSTGPGEWRVNPEVHRRFAERAAREIAERSAKRKKIEAAVEAHRKGADDV